jgi:glycosyltransferase involved in cell wall biosynthesis
MSITVIVASYKYGHLAGHCIEALLSQTRKPDKILFVDDAAGDCEHLPKIYPGIEFILRKDNLGTVANFNDMLQRVETERYMFIGADNWLRSDAIERIMNEDADIVNYDIIVTGTELQTFSKIRVPTHDHKKNVLVKTSIGEPLNPDFYWSRKTGHHGSMAYKTELSKQFGFQKRQGIKYTEEDKVLYDNAKKMNATVAHIPEGLLYYRTHKENFNKYA